MIPLLEWHDDAINPHTGIPGHATAAVGILRLSALELPNGRGRLYGVWYVREPQGSILQSGEVEQRWTGLVLPGAPTQLTLAKLHAERAALNIGHAIVRGIAADACTAVTGDDGIGLPTFVDRLAYAAAPYNERVVCSRADLMGTRRFYNLLRGDAAPTLAEVAALARACNVRPEWLAFGSGAMRTAPP
jgi:hypothetical protein